MIEVIHYITFETKVSTLNEKGLDWYLMPSLERLKKVCLHELNEKLGDINVENICIKLALSIEAIDASLIQERT